jgi:hypothetical protein
MIDENIMNQLVPQERGLSDLGEAGTFDALNVDCVWIEKDTDANELGIPEVIGCSLVSTSADDPLLITNVVNDSLLNVSGEYGLASFDQLTYQYKDIDTNEHFTGYSWPPEDPRAKWMYKLDIDPRATRDFEFVVDFIVKFDASAVEVPPVSQGDYDLYVSGTNAYRRDRVTFVQTVRNYTFRKLSSELYQFFHGDN